MNDIDMSVPILSFCSGYAGKGTINIIKDLAFLSSVRDVS